MKSGVQPRFSLIINICSGGCNGEISRNSASFPRSPLFVPQVLTTSVTPWYFKTNTIFCCLLINEQQHIGFCRVKVPVKAEKGIPVKIRNCPRNCECGRTGHIHCIERVGAAPPAVDAGRDPGRMMHESVYLPSPPDTTLLRGVRSESGEPLCLFPAVHPLHPGRNFYLNGKEKENP